MMAKYISLETIIEMYSMYEKMPKLDSDVIELEKKEPFYIPAHWNVKVFNINMDEEVVNCASCGKVLSFGEGYSSLEIHSRGGYRLLVCEKCYDEEHQRMTRRMEEGA